MTISPIDRIQSVDRRSPSVPVSMWRTYPAEDGAGDETSATSPTFREGVRAGQPLQGSHLFTVHFNSGLTQPADDIIDAASIRRRVGMKTDSEISEFASTIGAIVPVSRATRIRVLMKKAFLLCLVTSTLVAGGCATTARDNLIQYKVASDPIGCPIEVNGISMGRTPTTISLGASKTWVGLAFSRDGWEYGGESYEVTCLPPASSTEPLISQTKVIQPGTTPQGAEIYFNLRLSPYNPPTRIEIDKRGKEEITIKSEMPEDVESRLRKIKRLLDEGIISEEEYNSKRREIIGTM